MCAESENLQDNIEQCIHAVAPPKENTGVWGGGAHACVCETQREIEREREVRYRENISRPILMKLFAEVI